MKTARKATLVTYLLTGLLINSINLSCGKKSIDYGRQGEFVFINKTSHSISYPKGIEKYNILPNATVTITQTQESAKVVNAESYIAPFIIDYGFKTDPPILPIQFDGNRCWNPNNVSEHSPLELKNYIAEKLDERKYKFIYTFTEADYERAVACP